MKWPYVVSAWLGLCLGADYAWVMVPFPGYGSIISLIFFEIDQVKSLTF